MEPVEVPIKGPRECRSNGRGGAQGCDTVSLRRGLPPPLARDGLEVPGAGAVQVEGEGEKKTQFLLAAAASEGGRRETARDAFSSRRGPGFVKRGWS